MRARTTSWWLASMLLAGGAVAGMLLLSGANAQEAKLLPPVDPGVAPSGVTQTQGKDDKKDDKKEQIPKLPPTKVEAEPKTPALQPPVETPELPSVGNPLANGGIFGSPRVEGYRADSATSGTKVDTPLINYPGTISVIPRDVIQDQQALSVDDLLRNIPSAVKVTDFANLRDNFFLRGFEMASRDFRFNGFPDPSYVPRDFFNIERVEVMTGPASVLYGAGSPSGLINFITKQPLDTPYNNFQFTTGSYNLSRYQVDTTGPVGDGGLLYRINAEYQQADSFRDFGWSQRTGVAPVVAYALDANTLLSVEGSYQDTRRQLDTGLIFYNGAIQGPINRSFNEPTDYQRVDDYKGLVTLLHKFDENVTGRIQFFADAYNYTTFGTMPDIDPIIGNTQLYNAIAPLVGQMPLGPTQILRDTEATHLAEQFYDIRAELAAKFDGFLFKHTAVVGTEIGWYHSDFSSYQSDPGYGFNPLTGSPPSYVFNYANPTYGQVGGQPLYPSDFAHIAQERYGFYASDMIELTERLKVLAGVRYDIVNTDFANTFTSVNSLLTGIGQPTGSFPLTIEDRVDYYASPRVGVLWQPIKDVLSFYGTYVQSFDPPVTGVFATPTVLRPETGTSGEIGFKLELFEKRLSVQGTGYIIDKHNVVAQENFITSVQIGEIRSQGAEFSVVGKITDRWSVIGNYAYCDAKIINDPADAAIGVTSPGDRFRGVPYNTANLWSRYNLIDNQIHTLGVGVGIIYVGDRFGDLNDDFVLPGYTRVDAGIFYKRGFFNAAAYLENLGNARYYSGSFDANTITPGTPFNFRIMMGVTF